MGIFSKLFRKGASRENWPSISSALSKWLEEERTSWFDTCVAILQAESNRPKDQDSPEIRVVNTQLTGKAEYAIKAFQLCVVYNFIANHRYISPSEGSEFADLLYARVCDSQIFQCGPFLQRYSDRQIDQTTAFYRFSSDVTGYITESEAPIVETLLIGPSLPYFIALNHAGVAAAFGDQKTVNKIKSKFNQK